MKSFDEKLFEIVSRLFCLSVAVWAGGLLVAFIPSVTKKEWAFVYSDGYLQFILYSLVAMLALLSILGGISFGQFLHQKVANAIIRLRGATEPEWLWGIKQFLRFAQGAVTATFVVKQTQK